MERAPETPKKVRTDHSLPHYGSERILPADWFITEFFPMINERPKPTIFEESGVELNGLQLPDTPEQLLRLSGGSDHRCLVLRDEECLILSEKETVHKPEQHRESECDEQIFQEW